MEENKSFKPDKEILGKIQSEEENNNLSIIEKLRINGKAGYLPYLINLANITQHSSVKAAIFGLLNELKNKDAIPFLVEAIGDKKNKSILKKLVESCWENGLNYSQYLPVFIDLLIFENDEISFEAFTVIENLEYMPDDTILRKEIRKLEGHLDSVNETRKYFLNEAIKIISAVIG
jgi:hypothetical protein